ncbi:MAG TPA: hypothetical protein VHS99_19630 [Chloroflexota bacterium]|nr:hypothetical protein [Chloroflexota bacterium]
MNRSLPVQAAPRPATVNGSGRAAVEPGPAGAPPPRPRRLATPAALVLLLALAGATAVAPAWPHTLATNLLWFGGAWRTIMLVGCVVPALVVVAVNTSAPGAAWRRLRLVPARSRSWLPGALAVVLGAAAVAYNVGLLRGVTRSLRLFVLQLGLAPETPLAALALAVVAATLVADAGGRRLVLLAWDVWQRRPRVVERALLGAWPAYVAALGAGLLTATLFPAAMQGWARADGPDAQRYNFYTSFFNYSFNDERVVSHEGYEVGKMGLVLAPGRSGSIVFRLQRPGGSVVFLRPNFYNVPVDERQVVPGGTPFENALEVSVDGGRTYQTVLQNTSLGDVLGGYTHDLTPHLGTSSEYWLRFRATNTTEAEVTVLPSVVASVVADPLAAPDASFPLVPYAMALAALLYVAVRAGGRPAAEACLVALAGAAAAVVVAAAVWEGHAGGAVAATSATGAAETTGVSPAADAATAMAKQVLRLGVALALLSLAAVAWMRRRGAAVGAAPVPYLTVACLLVGLVALDARWEELMRVRYEFLLPDAQGYQAIAVDFPSKMAQYRSERPSPLLTELYASGYDGLASAFAVFYAGGNNGREPLWPAVLRLVFNVLGSSAFHTRLTSLALSVLVPVLTCWAGWRALHPLVGLMGGVVVAVSHPLIVNGVAGLREELVTALLVIMVSALFVGARRGGAVPWWRAAGAGVAGAGVVLVRADMVVLAGGLLTLGAIGLRWPLRTWLAGALIMGVLAGPMYVGYAFTHGDPFYPGTYGATVNRNLEFPERMGTPGFPSQEAYAASWAAGPMISPMKYFFGYHTPVEFVTYAARGFRRILTEILFKGQPMQLWLFVAGMALLLAHRRWLVPFAVLIALLPFYAFLAGVPNPWVFPSRYAHHVMPFAALAIGYCVWVIIQGLTWLPRRLVQRWAPGRQPVVQV